MSTLSFVEKQCYNCGSINRFGESGILSFNSPIGLDGHPGNLTPLFTAIHICPNCFYAAPDIAQGTEDVAEIIASPGYQAVVQATEIHELVRKYIAWALLQHKRNIPCEAGRTMLFATWLAEQYGDSSLTSQCRRKAIELMAQCRATQGNFEMTRGKEVITMVDLYRREQDFSAALEICEKALTSETLSEDDEFLIQYEKKLCIEKNAAFATIHDAETKF